MKHPLLLIIAGIIFLSSCLNVLYLFPQSTAFRSGALRASNSDAPEAVPGYLQAADNVIGYEISLTLVSLICSLLLLVCLILRNRNANAE